jgi:hypothetical protein
LPAPAPGVSMLRPIATMSRLQELFAAASALVGEARDRFLREHCANAPALREQVEELLRCDHEGGYLAEERLMALRAGLAGEAEALPERIGGVPHRLACSAAAAWASSTAPARSTRGATWR